MLPNRFSPWAALFGVTLQILRCLDPPSRLLAYFNLNNQRSYCKIIPLPPTAQPIFLSIKSA